MRAEVIGLQGGRFDVPPELRADGTEAPPVTYSLSLRPCWMKPPIRLRLAYAYTDVRTATVYYEILEKL